LPLKRSRAFNLSFIFHAAAALASFTHPGHIVDYVPGIRSVAALPQREIDWTSLIYRRWGISPRPENKRDNYNANDFLRQRITFIQIWFITPAYHTTIIVRIYPNREHKMIDPKKIEQIARQVHESMPKGIREFGEDVEKKIRQTLQSQLTRLDLVSREEFDVQTQVLLRTREKLALLEQRLNELENRNVPAEVKPAPAIPPVDAPDANA